MAKSTYEFRTEIVKALKASGKYSKGVDLQIFSLAVALRTLDLANEELDKLDTVVTVEKSRYGNDSLSPHPVFKILKDAQDSVTRQMKALGLTTEELTGTDDDDPLIDLTKKVRNSGRKKPNIIKRNTEPTE